MPLTDRIPRVSSRYHTPSVPEDLLDRIPLIVIPALLVLFVAVVGGAFTYVQIQHELSAGLTAPAPVPSITQKAIANTALAIQQTPAGQVIPTVSPPLTVTIPQSGVWVRVQYPGTFIGSVGARGILKQVNAIGDQFYQVEARDDIIDISITKKEGSNDLLAVEIYRDGTLVKRSTTSTPSGIIDLHVNLKS